MKRKLLAIFTSVLMLCAMLPLGAVSASAEVTTGTTGDCTWTLDGTHLTISGNGKMANYHTTGPWGASITSVSIEDGVTTIGNYAFYKCPFLTSMTIPDSVSLIGSCAFYKCTSLTSVTLGNGITLIYEEAFRYTALTDVFYLGNELDRQNINIGWSNDVLTSATWHYNSKPSHNHTYFITITDDATCVDDGVVTFSCTTCGDIYTTVLPATGNHIYDYPCDENCNICGKTRQPADHVYDDHYDTDCNICGVKRTITVTVGSTGDCTWTLVGGTLLTISGNGAMSDYEPAFGIETPWGCQITELVIEEGVTDIGDFAFAGCRNLMSATLPEGIHSIGRFAFYGSGLTSITLPDSLQNIWWGAFSGCNFNSITIPKNVKKIDCEAFSCCKSLTSITLPQSITTIEAGAFEECPALTDIYYAGSVASRDNMFGGSIHDTALKNATWHYAAEPISTTVSHSVMETENGNGLAFRFELAADGVSVKNRIEADLTNATVNYLGKDCKLLGMGAVMANDAAIGATAFALEDVNDITVLNIPAIYLCDLEPDSCAFAVRIINIPDSQVERTIYARPYYVVEVDGEEIVVYGDVDTASCAEYM